jgi:hypothetical protein
MAGFKMRELVPISVTCSPVVFIVSLNDDKDDMRQFDFNLASSPKVAIQQVVEIPSSKPAVGPTRRVLAYEADKKTPFKFGLRTVPVTMYLQGVRRPSARPDDIGFEYSYYKDQAAKQELCGATAVGTVLKVDPAFDVNPFGGASFQKRNKMLIDGEAEARVKVTPAGIVTPQWSTDDPLGVFSAPQSFQTHYDAGVVPTPPGNQGYVRVTLTGVATQPAGQAIQETIPVTLSAPTILQLGAGATSPAQNVVAANTGTGVLDLLAVSFPYEILDQNGVSIHAETAYAKRVPAIRENIRAVLSSPISPIQNWIATGLKSTNDWIDKISGKFTDRIEITSLDKDWIVVLVKGQRRFIAAADHPGAVIIEIPPPSTHIWYLGVRIPSGAVVWGIQEGCHNTFSSTVTRVTPATAGAVVREIQITTIYTVHTS